jgi:triphosphatase
MTILNLPTAAGFNGLRVAIAATHPGGHMAKRRTARTGGAKAGENAGPREIEVKLATDPSQFEQVDRCLCGIAEVGNIREQTLRSTYFDTHDLELRAAGLSFRIRTDGDRRIQTLKATRNGVGAALDRDEWEVEVKGDGPDPALLPIKRKGRFKVLDKPLAGLFTVHVERTILPVSIPNAEIEVSVDRGEVRAGHVTAPFAEVELELKGGAPQALFGFAEKLAGAAPLCLSFVTKAERGYEALAALPPQRVKAEDIVLPEDMCNADAFRAIAASCLRHLVANERVLRQRRDPEAVHQMRVALRRLRAAISIFKDMVSDARSESVKDELRWITGVLGAVRDLDIHITTVLEPARKNAPDNEAIRCAIVDAEARRESAYDAAQAALCSRRYGAAILAAASWAESGPWRETDETAGMRERSVRSFAKSELDRRWRRVRKRARNVEELEPEDRHQVRIAMKKLRYAGEFFESLFPGKKARKRRKAVLKTLSGLQDILGDLNDIAVGSRISESDALVDTQTQEERTEELLAAARQEIDRLEEMKPFW